MKRLIFFFLAGLAGGGLIMSLGRSADAADVRLTGFFQKYLDELFRQRPMEGTRLGDHRNDHRLDDLAPEARKAWTEHTRKTLEELERQFDYATLARANQIDYEIFKRHLQASLWLAENTHPFEDDPRTYNDYISDSIFLPLVQSSLPRATNVKNCVARMAYIPRVVATAKANLRNPPRVFVETAIRQNRGAISFFEHGIFEAAGETPQLSELGPAARPVIVALKDYQQFLENDLLPRAHGDWRLGKERFVRKLDFDLGAGLTADEVLQEADVEAERVRRDMYVIARQLWGQLFPGKPLPPDDSQGRRSAVQRVLLETNKEHNHIEELVRDARDIVAQIKAFIKDNDILRLPDPDLCRVVEMPEFQRGNTIAYLNPAPPLDVHAASLYAISPPPRDWDARRVDSYLQEYNRHMMHILTIHEGYPGHYVQLAYGNRHPSLIRKVLSSGAFAEGWAVYTEQMMLDQGYGKGDPALRLNQLKFYLRAVVNATLDHKMHCANMSDEAALKLLTEGAFQTEGEALLKIIRAKQSSCQLSTYFVGRTAFYRLRQQFQRAQGDHFDLGRYHEAVLDHGTLPVKYLPELVRERLKHPR